MPASFGPRRALFLDVHEEPTGESGPLSRQELDAFERFDLLYRSLCAMLYNYVPLSGHPGGSISSGRIASSLVFGGMDYDVSRPDGDEADVLSYAAGHKALGLYALWALRNEIVKVTSPGLLPRDERHQLRLEDLLGFRKNPQGMTALQKKLHVKALDGHPTPATPFVRLSTGASGVGLAASIGLAIGAVDRYGPDAPVIHVLEGEGGMTPGRVSEAMAAAGTMSLGNVVLHVDWNQASIDSNHVCRDGEEPGDYVQWDPAELAYLHDWNVIQVPQGMLFPEIASAQKQAASLANGQPTAIIYRTVKGWKYGIEGRASHGAGHKLCAEGFFDAIEPLLREAAAVLPRCAAENQRCAGGRKPGVMDECFWEAITVIRNELARSTQVLEVLGGRLGAARERLASKKRTARAAAPRREAVRELARRQARAIPEALRLKPGASTTLRGELGRALGWYNKESGGAFLIASADLMGSTSANVAGAGFGDGWFNARTNAGARLLATGGICEDAMTGILGGISSYGHAIGVGSSYGAFLAPLGHIAARLHAIGCQARRARTREDYNPLILVCAHAGLKTGEDGPTHADPQALQLLQGNFPSGTLITLTPWDPGEIWVLLSAALAKSPAVIAVFVTRPNETVPDRAALGLAPVAQAANGVYRLRGARGKRSAGTVVLQGSEVAFAFVRETLPLLLKEGIDLDAWYVASAELFDLLSPARREEIFPEKAGARALGITGFTLPTMHRWITSERGRAATLHPFRKGHFLGSGQAELVMKEAGLDGRSQSAAIKTFLKER
jgi:transketolase